MRSSQYGEGKAHQILMMSSLTCFVRWILACMHRRRHRRTYSKRGTMKRDREGPRDLVERSLPRKKLMGVEHLLLLDFFVHPPCSFLIPN